MRILQVIPYFYPAEAYGGPVQVANHLSKELVRRGHEVVIYTTDTLDRSTRQKARYLEIQGIKVHYFRNLSNSLAWYGSSFAPGIIPQIRNEIKTFDVVHLQDYRDFQNIVIHHYARKYNVPYLVQAHGSVATFFQKRILKRIFDWFWGYKILKDAAKLIALTPLEVEQYKSMGVSEDKVEIIPNGIDLYEFENLPQRGEFRKKYGIENDQKIILYLGRICKPKGLELLAKAFANVTKEINDVRMIVAGPDDGYLLELRKLLKELKVEDKTLLTGPLYGRDKLEVYVDADVFATPSFTGFPITFVEACATGTPIVTTEKGDCLNWIHNQVGYMTAYDQKELGNALANILSYRGIAEQFGERGQQIAIERFNWVTIAQQVERVYFKCTRDIIIHSHQGE